MIWVSKKSKCKVFLKSQICNFSFFTKMERFNLIFVLRIGIWKLLCFNSTSWICDFQVFLYFCEFFIRSKIPLELDCRANTLPCSQQLSLTTSLWWCFLIISVGPMPPFWCHSTPSYQGAWFDHCVDLRTTGTHLIWLLKFVPQLLQNQNKASAYLFFLNLLVLVCT